MLHNFAWHEHYTWDDLAPTARAPAAARGLHQALISRLVRFHLGNGAVSIVGNLVLMKLFTGELHIPVLAANAIAITACSLVNFCLADRWVFARG